jgi:signal-transduction protein with cAMP-binding, CBS, and nucleotidyltransferase domain
MQTAEQIVRRNNKEILTTDENAKVIDAVKLMNERKVGSIFIKKDEKIIGVWTERDLLKNSVVEGFDPKTAKIADYMKTNLISVPHDSTNYHLMDVFLGKRIRHLLIEKDGEFIGLVSPGDIMKAYILEKDGELRDLNAMVSWEYYENWRWDPSKS